MRVKKTIIISLISFIMFLILLSILYLGSYIDKQNNENNLYKNDFLLKILIALIIPLANNIT
jgi:hypothetical protein